MLLAFLSDADWFGGTLAEAKGSRLYSSASASVILVAAGHGAEKSAILANVCV